MSGKNKVIESLKGECSAYIAFNQKIDPIRVKKMIDEAYQEGLKRDTIDSLKYSLPKLNEEETK